jgi:hypothetical protein
MRTMQIAKDVLRGWMSTRGFFMICLIVGMVHLANVSPVASILIVIVLIPSIASTMTLWDSFPSYRRTYDAILSGSLSVVAMHDPINPNTMLALARCPGDPLDEWVVYHVKERNIRLLGGKYLFNNPFTYMNPYSFYWMVKIRGLLDRVVAGEDIMQIRRDSRISKLL